MTTATAQPVQISTKVLMAYADGNAIIGPAVWAVTRRYADGTVETTYHDQTREQARSNHP